MAQWRLTNNLLAWLTGLLLAGILPALADGSRQGELLVATPRLGDPNFTETVVLIIEDGGDGTMGLVINRPTGVAASDVLPSIEGLAELDVPLFAGGPVAGNGVIMLILTDDPPADARRIAGNIHVSASRDFLRELAQRKRIRDQLRLYAGHAGWSPGQLDAEIARGDWRVVASSESLVFSDQPLGLWQQLIRPARRQIVYK